MRLNKSFYFTLHSSIIPVKGHKKSVICNLQNNTYRAISNEVCQLLIDFNGHKILSLYEAYSITEHPVLDEIFNFLYTNEYILISKTKSNIKELPFKQHLIPEIINNSIIDYDKNSNLINVFKFINELNNFGCKNLSLRFFDEFESKKNINSILTHLKSTTIRYVELTINSTMFNFEELVELLNNNPRIYIVWVFGAKNEDFFENNHQKIFISKTKKIDSNDCGQINSKYFFSDYLMFSLNKNVNSCLFSKISLDVHGNIKNCPSLEKKFGNITTSTLNDVIEDPEFKELWHINKDQIKTCKDCEYRYICSDCRAFIDNKYDKPFKCKYNPYEGIWEN